MRSFLWMTLLGFVACGGIAVIDGESTSASSSSATTTTTTATNSSSSGGMGCTDHGDCPLDSVCIFVTGTCAPACDAFGCGSCGPGSVCNGCATASCPDCLDCIGACLPATPGSCDNHDDCPDGLVCVFSSQTCSEPCPGAGNCNDASVCDECATSSCPCCEDCQPACVPA